MARLLHEENILRLAHFGEHIRDGLIQRVGEVALAASGVDDPNVSVVIRSRNNIEQLEWLLADIKAQDFNGEVEVVLVDTESTDGTVEAARKFGATIVPILQRDFTYPGALNKGFEAASHDWVYTLVDHCRLTNDQIFHQATRAQDFGDIAGVSGVEFPGANSSRTERIASLFKLPSAVKKPAHFVTEPVMGLLAANTSLVNRDAWRELGGFDERYGAGGEDYALGESMLNAGYRILSDTAMSAYHSHGVNLIDGARQVLYWNRIIKGPKDFDRAELEKFRSSSSLK